MKTQTLTAEQAKANGFATMNNGDHLCVELPEGHCTISALTPTGEKITFAFIPRAAPTKNLPGHQCVEITNHTSDKITDDGLPQQKAIVFGKGPMYYHSGHNENHQATQLTLVLPETKDVITGRKRNLT